MFHTGQDLTYKAIVNFKILKAKNLNVKSLNAEIPICA